MRWSETLPKRRQGRHWSSTSGAGGFENDAWIVGSGRSFGSTKHDTFLAVGGGF